MTVLRKLTKKQWIVVVALLVIIIGGGVGARIFLHERSGVQDKAKVQVYRQICSDLLYLEQFDTLKLKPAQAKQILPLIDRMSASSDANTQLDLAKQIYGILTPVQYETLLTSQPDSGQNKLDARNNRTDREDGNYREERDSRVEHGIRPQPNPNNLRLQAMGNVVNAMLKQRANETTPVAP